MPDILNTSLSGMIAFQRALAVTSHNIANASTPGYSRQIAEFSTRVGTGEGQQYIGGGTQISEVRRIYDSILGDHLRETTAGQAHFDTLSTFAGRLDSLLADPDSGINTSFQRFFNSLQDLSNDPSSIPVRQVFLAEAGGLADRIVGLDDELASIEGEVNQRIRLAVDDVNRLIDSIAAINSQIGGGTPPNDLLDQRDRLIRELSGQVNVNTALQSDGSISVFFASGQPLVVGTETRGLSVEGSEFDATKLTIVHEADGSSSRIDNVIGGGVLGGLLQFRQELLNPAQQALGQTTLALAQTFNQQHAEGMDLRGELGGDFFNVSDPKILPSRNNTGTGTAVATVANLGSYTGANYLLSYDGSAYSLARQDTGAVLPLGGSGTVGDPFTADGLEIVVSGAPAAGDRLLIRTGEDVAASIRTVVVDADRIAAARPVRTSADLGNLGTASISLQSVDDSADPNLLSTTTIEFLTPTTYSINGAGSFAYVDGDAISVDGRTVSISGEPQAGDVFTIAANNGASGDNGNALLLSDLQTIGLLDGGIVSINDNYGQLVADIGASTHQIQSRLDAQNALLRNVEDEVLSTSAVNLDEEAARLIQYQQSYQAMAQVIAVANSLFDTLIGATRR